MNNTKEQTTMDFIIPEKYWFTLKEACALKNLNYKTACNRTKYQPNNGKMDGKIGGKKCFRRETVLAWLALSDEQIDLQLQ